MYDNKPICFTFRKRYEMFKILEMTDTATDAWDSIR